jgi:hypothetical protein
MTEAATLSGKSTIAALSAFAFSTSSRLGRADPSDVPTATGDRVDTS